LLHGSGATTAMAEEDCLLAHLNPPAPADVLNLHQAGFPSSAIQLALQGNGLGISPMGPAHD
jgi:hypothetical protein